MRHAQFEVEKLTLLQTESCEPRTNGTVKTSYEKNYYSSNMTALERNIKQLQEEAMPRHNRHLRKQLRGLVSSTTKHRLSDTDGDTNDNVTPSVDAIGHFYTSRTPSLVGLHAVQALHDKIAGLHRVKGHKSSQTTTTTVTREKNKLIIKQQPVTSEKKEKRLQGKERSHR